MHRFTDKNVNVRTKFCPCKTRKKKSDRRNKRFCQTGQIQKMAFYVLLYCQSEKKIDYLAKINKELNIILMMMIIIWVQFLKCLQLPIDQYKVVMLVNLHHSISTEHRLG